VLCNFKGERVLVYRNALTLVYLARQERSVWQPFDL
jgi:hypothetical protein